MKIIRSIQMIKDEVEKIAHKKIGFVPTMGYLHEGHLSLVEQARNENDIVIMSIFVNPLQFGPNEDFATYPKDEQTDIRIAKEKGVDILFMPTTKAMYPEELAIQIEILKGTDVLCGRSRPGHFDGVATVLSKLFHLVQPTNIYFGLKDAQQFAIVHTLVSQLNFPVNLIGLPTVRESDGLAKSSRNVYLSESERKEATVLDASLTYAQQLIVDGIHNPATIMREVKKYIKKHTSAKIDYVELLYYPTLNKPSLIDGQIIVAVAIQFKQARLIDNIILTKEGKHIDRIVERG